MNKPYITKVHIIIEVLAGLTALAALTVAIVFAAAEKGPVPTHYDIQGNADAWGSAWGMAVMPVIMLVSCAGMSLMMHFASPNAWNLGIRVRPSRKILIISDACLLMVLLELELAMFSLGFTVVSVLDIGGNACLILTALLMISMTASVVFYFVRANRHNKM